MRAGMLLIAMVACGGGCDPAPGKDPTTFHELAVALKQVDCEALHRCCGTTCTSNVDDAFNRNLDETQRMIDSGDLAFEPTVGAQCLAAYRAHLADCDARNGPFTATALCDRALHGTIAIGQRCTSPDSCVANAYCDNFSYCKAYVQVGGVCRGGFSNDCAPGLFCNQFSECEQAPTRGQTCFSNSCDSSTEPLVCTSARTCQPPLRTGEPCVSPNDCGSGNCDGSPNVCQPAPYKDTLRFALCH